ncbi:hypothetical protein [Planococcus sp. NCCP-2050]|uniref:hypothetical protein n=1 Tax=Planococcus sp. NCCP-2050 TaxID=2944679 RepID=UPI00203EC0D2|nr:hypothetical protein [Planococcus sp. NCCP-2050]
MKPIWKIPLSLTASIQKKIFTDRNNKQKTLALSRTNGECEGFCFYIAALAAKHEKSCPKLLLGQLFFQAVEKLSAAFFIPLQPDAFRGLAPSRFVAALLQGLGPSLSRRSRRLPLCKTPRASVCPRAGFPDSRHAKHQKNGPPSGQEGLKNQQLSFLITCQVLF